MKLFGQLVRTVVNTAKLPLAVTKDVLTLGGAIEGRGSYTAEQLETLVEGADED